MTITQPAPGTVGEPSDEPRILSVERSRTDRVYRSLTLVAGSVTLVVIVLIFVFLIGRSWTAISRVGIFDFLTTTQWQAGDDPPDFGVAALLWGTVVVAVIALVIAVPLALGAALFINEYAPLRVRIVLTGLVDLLAAVPSVIYGIWGLQFLVPRMEGFVAWLTDYLGFIPFFKTTSGVYTNTMFNAGVVVACMVLPIVTAVVRQVFSQAPRSECEAALALGGTRWGMVRTVLLPFGRGGVIGGSMLGLGRALGETIAVLLIIIPSYEITIRILEPGGTTAASHIATNFQNSSPFEVRALLAAGLALFVMTLVVNMIATAIVSRSRSGQGVEL